MTNGIAKKSAFLIAFVFTTFLSITYYIEHLIISDNLSEYFFDEVTYYGLIFDYIVIFISSYLTIHLITKNIKRSHGREIIDTGQFNNDGKFKVIWIAFAYSLLYLFFNFVGLKGLYLLLDVDIEFTVKNLIGMNFRNAIMFGFVLSAFYRII